MEKEKEIYEMGKEIFNYLKDNFRIYTVEECKQLEKDKGAYGVIYITQCKVNSKLYIGQKKIDTNDFNTYLGSGKIFKQAVDKYDKDNFERVILEVAYSEEELDKFEIKYIELFDASEKYNRDLFYNIALGGNVGGVRLKGEDNPMYGKHHSEETKKKISEANKGRKVSEETREKLSKAGKGRKVSEEHKKRISKANKDRKHNEEERKKQSEAQKGRKVSEETREKLSKAGKGKHHSEETKKKISEANKGNKLSEEAKKKLSEVKKGKKVDKIKGIKNGNAKLVVAIFPDWRVIKDVCIKELAKELKISERMVSDILKSEQPYTPKKSHLKHLDGIIIISQEDYLKDYFNANINDDKAS